MIETGSAAIPPRLFYDAALVLIEQQPDPNLRADLRERFEHRAAVAEYDGMLSREEAERLAFRELREVLGVRT